MTPLARIFHRHHATYAFHVWSMRARIPSLRAVQCDCQAIRFPDAPFRRLRRWSRRGR